MDMKRILQAMDGVSTKPVEGVNDMAKFLSVVDKNASVQILNEASPHKVTLPVQMAMQHYQTDQVSSKTINEKKISRLKSYYQTVEEELAEEQTSKRQLINQYASSIAERVLMKEAANPAQQAAIAIAKKKKKGLSEKWSEKYKRSINCSHPKGFSQKAHCAGKKKHNEDIEMEMVCPDCGMCETHGNHMMETRQRLDAKCWKGKHKEGTKIKGGVRVNNCVPNEGVAEDTVDQNGSVHNLGFKPLSGVGMQNYVVDEAPIAIDPAEPNNPLIHSHQKANPAKLKDRIMHTRAQLKELAELAQSDDLAVWEQICAKAKGGMFMGLEQNLEQIRHAIAELAQARKTGKGAGGAKVRGQIHKHIGESNPIKEANAKKKTLKNSNPCWKGYHPVGTKKKGGKTVPNCVPTNEDLKPIKPKKKTSVCKSGQVQTGMQTKDGKLVPKCSVK